MSPNQSSQRSILQRIAKQAMIDRGFQPEFTPAVMAEVQRLPAHPADGATARDLRDLPWCSIDNDDSRDLDQLTVARPQEGDTLRILVAIANVSALVEPGSAVDDHAVANTTSIYTPARIFPMLPERLSTDLTSLNPDDDRLAMVVEMTVGPDGQVTASEVYPARVRNQAKLAYPSVGAWLEGTGAAPAALTAVPGLDDNLRVQDRAAQKLKERRHVLGALEFESLEVKATFDGDAVATLEAERRNRARDLIEDFMIAANSTIAAFLEQRKFPVLRRVVRTPARWPRIVDIAVALGDSLPEKPDPVALHQFLVRRRAADALRFPDLSLSIIKLLGSGEYVASLPGEPITGHFGLAVTEYTHSTAPNRRYPDLITQRLLKAALAGAPVPLSRDQLEALATHCTQKEDDAQKVERQVRKSAAACLLSSRIGDKFDGVVTGASEKGTWVRIFHPPVEGRVERNATGLDVGDRVKVKLLHTNVEKGFIDFARIDREAQAPAR